jgi:hypothetical protein
MAIIHSFQRGEEPPGLQMKMEFISDNDAVTLQFADDGGHSFILVSLDARETARLATHAAIITGHIVRDQADELDSVRVTDRA